MDSDRLVSAITVLIRNGIIYEGVQKSFMKLREYGNSSDGQMHDSQTANEIGAWTWSLGHTACHRMSQFG